MLALALIATDARAGGWPLAPGSAEIITSATRLRTDQRFDGEGKKRWTSRYTKLEISPYMEYGLAENLTLVGEAAWTRETTDYFGTTFKNEDVSRLKAGARLALGTWQETLFSLQPLATLHLMEAGDDPAATKSGDMDAELALVLARSGRLLGLDVFSVQEVGYNYRDRSRPDEMRADITLGLKPWPGTMFLLKSLNTAAVKRTASGQLYRASKLEVSVVQSLPEWIAPGWSIEGGMEETIAGRSSVTGTTAKFALWYRF
ncbi:MAG: hypothetical protein K9G30_08630 [Parvibaculum sp.]|nr:hypothetical protein [Parvibaculum sp.]